VIFFLEDLKTGEIVFFRRDALQMPPGYRLLGQMPGNADDEYELRRRFVKDRTGIREYHKRIRPRVLALLAAEVRG